MGQRYLVIMLSGYRVISVMNEVVAGFLRAAPPIHVVFSRKWAYIMQNFQLDAVIFNSFNRREEGEAKSLIFYKTATFAVFLPEGLIIKIVFLAWE